MSFSFPLSSLPLSSERIQLETLLKPGARFSARVTGVLSDGRIRLSFSGQSLILRPEKPLIQGGFVELRVHGGAKGTVLEITPQAPSSQGTKPSSFQGLKDGEGLWAQARTGEGSRTLQRLQDLLVPTSFFRKEGAEEGKGVSFLQALSLGESAHDTLPFLRGWVRAFLQEPSHTGLTPEEGREVESFSPEEGPHPSLAALVEKMEGREGLEILHEFRESLAKLLLDQGQLVLPIPLSLDGFFVFGRLFLDLGDWGRGSQESRIFRAGIRLELESLGHIRIDALLFGRELQLGFGAEEASVLSLFEDGAPDLVSRLEAMGFRVLPLRYQILERSAWENDGVPGLKRDGDWGIIA